MANDPGDKFFQSFEQWRSDKESDINDMKLKMSEIDYTMREFLRFLKEVGLMTKANSKDVKELTRVFFQSVKRDEKGKMRSWSRKDIDQELKEFSSKNIISSMYGKGPFDQKQVMKVLSTIEKLVVVLERTTKTLEKYGNKVAGMFQGGGKGSSKPNKASGSLASSVQQMVQAKNAEQLMKGIANIGTTLIGYFSGGGFWRKLSKGIFDAIKMSGLVKNTFSDIIKLGIFLMSSKIREWFGPKIAGIVAAISSVVAAIWASKALNLLGNKTLGMGGGGKWTAVQKAYARDLRAARFSTAGTNATANVLAVKAKYRGMSPTELAETGRNYNISNAKLGLPRGLKTGTILGAAGGVLNAYGEYSDSKAKGESTGKAATKAGGGILASVAAGAATGAVAGSVAPVIGNIGGLIVGSLVGALTYWGASSAFNALVDKIWDSGNRNSNFAKSDDIYNLYNGGSSQGGSDRGGSRPNNENLNKRAKAYQKNQEYYQKVKENKYNFWTGKYTQDAVKERYRKEYASKKLSGLYANRGDLSGAEKLKRDAEYAKIVESPEAYKYADTRLQNYLKNEPAKLQTERRAIQNGGSLGLSNDYGITSPYGWRQSTKTFHRGVDIGSYKGRRLDIGSPFKIPIGGKVLSIGFDAGGWGNYFTLAGDDGLTHLFGHFNKINVKKDQKVTAGTVVAEVGNTGRSEGPHVHMESWQDKNGKRTYYDPKTGKPASTQPSGAIPSLNTQAASAPATTTDTVAENFRSPVEELDQTGNVTFSEMLASGTRVILSQSQWYNV